MDETGICKHKLIPFSKPRDWHVTFGESSCKFGMTLVSCLVSASASFSSVSTLDLFLLTEDPSWVGPRYSGVIQVRVEQLESNAYEIKRCMWIFLNLQMLNYVQNWIVNERTCFNCYKKWPNRTALLQFPDNHDEE